MANVKISDLTAYTDPATTDVLPIVDLVNDETKKVKVEDLLKSVAFDAGTAALPSIAFGGNGDPDTGIYSPGANQLAISTGGTGRLFVDASGNVGLGTSTPGSYLSGANQFVIADTSASTGLTIATPDTSSGSIVFAEGTGSADNARGIIRYTHNTTGANGYMQFSVNSAPEMTLTTTGLGINTTSPAYQLTLSSNSSFWEAGLDTEVNGSTHTLKIISDAFGGGGRTGDIAFYTNNATAERLRITDAGNVGIGATSPAADLHLKSSTSGKPELRIEGSGADNGLITFLGGGHANPAVGIRYISTGDSIGNLAFYANNSSSSTLSERMRLDNSGRLLVGTSTAVNNGLIQAEGTGDSIVHVRRNTNSLSSGPALQLRRSYGTSLNSFTAVPDDGNCGYVQFFGSQGSADALVAQISAAADGQTLASGDNPGRLVFSTTADGASSPTERMRIDSSGNVLVGKTVSSGLNAGCEFRAAGLGLFTRDSANPLQVRRLTDDGDLVEFYKDSILRGSIGVSGTSLTIGVAGNEKLRIDSSGRLGLGTSSPRGLLHVGPDLASGATDAARINLKQNGSAATDGIYLERSGERRGYHMFIGGPSDGLTFRANNFGTFTTAMYLNREGKVGIGTTSPDYQLCLEGTGVVRHKITCTNNHGAGAGVYMRTLNAGSTVGTATIAIDNTGNFKIFSGASTESERMRIDSSGNLLHGMTFSDLFATHNFMTAGGFAVQYTGTTGTYLSIIPGSANGNVVLKADARSGAYPPMVFTTGGSERMRIDSSGRLLVGTSTSASGSFSYYARLQVQGHYQGSTDEARISFQRGQSSASMSNGDKIALISFADKDGGDYAFIEAYADSTPGSSDYPGRLVFSVTSDGSASPTARMVIKNNGDVHIGGSDTVNSPFIELNQNGTSQFQGKLTIATAAAAGTQIFQAYGAAGEARIFGDGDLENTNNSYAGLSDIKLKENIVDANSQWDDLKTLQVRNYNFKPETGYSTHTQIGLIAQEVELVSPGLVGESIDEETGESTKSVNYSVLYMKAVKALQEAMERIETLEAKVAALEAS